MRTNVDINDDLLNKAMKITGTKTKKDTIHLALEELIKKHRLRQFANKIGGIKWEGDLNEWRKGKWTT